MPELEPAIYPERPVEDSRYLKEQIITYIGNKRSLLNFIGKGVEIVKKRLSKESLSSFDVFSGSGIIARFLKQHSSILIANDLEFYSKIVNQCYLSNKSEVNLGELRSAQKYIADGIIANWLPRFITNLYAPKDENNISKEDRVFYTRRNAIYLDTARQEIAKIDPALQPLFLGPLLAAASIHNNTSGVFKGFYKGKDGVGAYGGHGKNALSRILGNISLELPILSRFECEYKVYQKDANKLIHELKEEVDFAYMDPPYNQHPYGSNYFMLNILAKNELPMKISHVSGIPNDWNRSLYNKKSEAEKALFSLVESCPAKFVLISYNSEGFISYASFLNKLMKVGNVSALETEYNTFRGSRNLKERALTVTEYLFLLEKH